MVTLIVTLCLGTVCVEREYPVYGAGMGACLTGAQAELARIVREGERVEKWRCKA